VTLVFSDGYGNIDMQLYDACGGSVVASATSTTSNETLTYAHSGPPGDLYIRVYLSDDTRNNYNIMVSGASVDCNDNGIVDVCELDCGQPGAGCEIPGCGTAQDCNTNANPDDCDIADFVSFDCNSNGVPDECDLGEGTSADCNTNNIPDECDIAGGAPDCQPNGVPDTCDIDGGTSVDVNTNGVPDECEVASVESASSCCQHGPIGEICIDMGIGGGFRVTGDNVDSRAGCVHKMVYRTNVGVSSLSGSVDCQSSAYDGTVTPYADGSTTCALEFEPALPMNDCCTITLGGDLEGQWAVASLQGDVNQDLAVTPLDYAALSLRLGQTTDSSNARFDVNVNGEIDPLDFAGISLNLGVSMPGCP
jgi:hypothetical protein